MDHDATIDHLTDGLPLNIVLDAAGAMDYVRTLAKGKSNPYLAWVTFVYQIEAWMLDPQYKSLLKSYIDYNKGIKEGPNFKGVYYEFETIFDPQTGLSSLIWNYYNNADNHYLGSVFH